MPAKSGKQYRAMQAAAHGKGNLGIPKKVAQEFVRATPKTKRKRWAKKKKGLQMKRSGKNSLRAV